jgi:transcriptional regulator with XRE-family HTH domain
MARPKRHFDIPAILDQIIGGKSQREIASEIGIDAGQLSHLLSADEDIIQRSARARLASAESWLDRGLDYVMDERNDPARARIVAQECARRAAIRNQAYRDKIDTTIANADGTNITGFTVTLVEAGKK